MTLEDYYETIENKEQFIVFLDQLYQDLKKNEEEYDVLPTSQLGVYCY